MLSQNIRNLRKQHGYTQETFAQELNVVRQTVSKWEKGYSVPDAVMLEKIAELFEISVGELLSVEQTKTEEDKNYEKGSREELQAISSQLSILNNQLAKELARKRKNRRIALITVLVILLAVFVGLVFVIMPRPVHTPDYDGYGYVENSNAITDVILDSALDEAVSAAIMANNQSPYLLGECATESHYVFDVERNGDIVTVYLLEDYSNFGFISGYFVEGSGGIGPAVYKFISTARGYEYQGCERPEDGERHSESVRELFPKNIARRIIRGLKQSEYDLLWEIRVRQAVSYLDSIGRQPLVCRYGDIEKVLLTDCGIEIPVEEKITRERSEYDYFIGNHEQIENGIRYVYQTAYDKEDELVTFTKFEYESGSIVEFFAYDAYTGNYVPDAPVPERVRFYKAELKTDMQTVCEYTTLARRG